MFGRVPYIEQHYSAWDSAFWDICFYTWCNDFFAFIVCLTKMQEHPKNVRFFEWISAQEVI
jgi:hypothetical protein